MFLQPLLLPTSAATLSNNSVAIYMHEQSIMPGILSHIWLQGFPHSLFGERIRSRNSGCVYKCNVTVGSSQVSRYKKCVTDLSFGDFFALFRCIWPPRIYTWVKKVTRTLEFGPKLAQNPLSGTILTSCMYIYIRGLTEENESEKSTYPTENELILRLLPNAAYFTLPWESSGLEKMLCCIFLDIFCAF